MLFAKLSGQKSPAADAWRNRGEVRAVTSERQNVFLDLDGKFLVVGERINPTGKKKLQEELRAGEYKITWKPVTSSRLDSKALKAAAPELVERFTRTTTNRRFCVA